MIFLKWKKIGDILVVDNKFSKTSVDSLRSLALKHRVKSIVKINHIGGEMREPSLEIIYGDETETVHKENGCLFNLDLSKVMWAKGNNNERLRIAKLVEDGEVVVDMFAGIGYFSIPIGVHSNAEKIYSIEINPNSHHFLCRNVELNKINKKAGYDRLVPILGDCRIEAPKYSADRVLMGYVKTTHHYLNPAIEAVKEGGIVHYHETVPEKLIETRPFERFKKAADVYGRDIEVLNIQNIKKYSPGVDHVVLDVKVY